MAVQQSMRMRSNDFYSSPATGLATAYYKIEFDGPFDTAQWLITSRVTSGTPGTYKVQMAVTDTIAVDTINNAFVPMRAGVAYNDTSANGWQNATFGGAASKQIGLAPVSANNYGVITMATDALPLASIARADGKAGGILLVKVVQVDTAGSFTQDSSANSTWDNARGANAWFREFFVTKRTNVDGIATLTNLPTSVSEGSTGYAICGCPVVSSSTATSGDLILFTGDSRKSSAYSTYQFNNASRQAVMSLSSAAHPLCTVDAAGSGHSQDQYLAVAMDLLNAGIRPTIIGLPGFSQNGFTTYSAFKTANDNFMSSVRAISGLANVKFVMDTDYYTSGYAAAKEAYRQQCISYAKSLVNNSTVFCFDSDAIMTDYSNSAAPVLRSAYMNSDGVHANQAGQDAMSYGDKNGAGLMAMYRNILSITDTTAPTLTLPAATQNGSFAATGTVKTNESGGVLYYLASTSPTATAAQVMAASSKAPVVAGTVTVAFTGLPAGTVMYPHYVHVDDSGNVSSVADGASFTTPAQRNAVLSASLASMGLSSTGTSQQPIHASMAATLAAMTLATNGHAQPAPRVGTYQAAMAALSMSATGHAQPAPRVGGYSVALAGMQLIASGHAQRPDRHGSYVVSLADMQMAAAGHAKQPDRIAILAATFGDAKLLAKGGAFAFSRSPARTYRVSTRLPGSPVIFPVVAGTRLDFSFDWSDWMADADDEIAGYAIRQPNAVVRSGVMKAGQVVTAFVASDRAGYDWPIWCDIQTAAGRTDSRQIVMRVVPR